MPVVVSKEDEIETEQRYINSENKKVTVVRLFFRIIHHFHPL
jgi:hypothetical protein